MFHSTRIKLTAWYFLIIMLISISFSAAIYRVLTSELDRVERMQKLRIEHRLPERFRIIPPQNDDLSRSLYWDPEVIEETKKRIKIILIAINLAILGISTGAGYFLAGRTLRPIKDMVEEQSRFISDASHELRTPLTSLKSEIEVNLRDKHLTLSDAKKLLESNLEEVNSLQVLSDGLIKLTQYQKMKNGLSVESLSSTAIAFESIKKIAGLAKKKNISIVNDAKDYPFEGNRQTLVELLVIFLDNAIKYSPKATKINISSEKIDGNIFIHIKDQGIGVDKRDIPHLFDRFYRADKSRTKSNVSGYGLGLSIAKQIVDRHKGSVTVKSKVGEGSTFTVQIPEKHSIHVTKLPLFS